VVASPGLSSPIRLAGLSHHVWLMGDGVNDSFNNGIRNSVYPTDTNDAVLQLTNMVASDIETVSIPGLT
jgi:hypothetical protein